MTNRIRILVEGSQAPAEPRDVSSREAVVDALVHAERGQVWIVRAQESLADVVRAMAEAPTGARHAVFISYKRPDPSVAQVIESAFAHVLLGAPAMVEPDELVEILREEHPEDYCVGAEWVEETNSLALWRGDLSVLVVPMRAFRMRSGVAPDASKLSIVDSGQTIRLGDYEVSVDSILFDRDAEYRRRARKRMIREEQSLGASIRRLRIARGVRRNEFPGLDEKTLGRIERNESETPHAATLKTIAKRLGVSVEELAEY